MEVRHQAKYTQLQTRIRRFGLQLSVLLVLLGAAHCRSGVVIEGYGKLPDRGVDPGLRAHSQRTALRVLMHTRRAFHQRTVWFASLQELAQKDAVAAGLELRTTLALAYAGAVMDLLFVLIPVNLIYYPLTGDSLFFTVQTKRHHLDSRGISRLLIQLAGHRSGPFGRGRGGIGRRGSVRAASWITLTRGNFRTCCTTQT